MHYMNDCSIKIQTNVTTVLVVVLAEAHVYIVALFSCCLKTFISHNFIKIAAEPYVCMSFVQHALMTLH